MSVTRAEPAETLAIRFSFVLCAIILAALVGSCRREEPQLVYDILRLFPFTENGVEPVAIELGSARARAYLDDGWSAPETLPGGETAVWAVGRKAVLQFDLLRAVDREMVLRCASFPARPDRPQRISLHLNGGRLVTLPLVEGMHEYRIPLPARLQDLGRNTLTFSGGARGRSGQRIGVAVHSIRFVPPADQPPPAATVTEDALVLTNPGRLNYFLRIPEAAQLAFGLEGQGAHLEVVAQREAEAERTLLRGRGAGSSVTIDLSDYAGDLARVGLRAVGDGASLRLLRPHVRAPRPASRAPTTAPYGTRSNVLLYLIDTLRADHLGCYGYARPTSPRIDAFAQEGMLFIDVAAQASWTRPATASILTGLYPPAHGAITLRDGLRGGVPTLAEVLKANGYRTAAFVTNVNVAGTWGFQRGFDAYEYLEEDANGPTVHVRADELNAHVLPWLREHRDEPFFLYVHATDPHAPYTPPSAYAEKLAAGIACLPASRSRPLLDRFAEHPAEASPEQIRALEACYDAEIAFTDGNFGVLLDELTRLGLADTTAVVLTADHGEEFFDHGGFEHGRTLYQEQLHVPLIMRLPGGARAKRVSVRARQIDVLPTLLDHLGVASPPAVQGRSLLPFLDSPDDPDPVDSFAQTHLGRRRLEAVMTGPWKAVQARFRGTDRMEVYDLRTDSRERDNAIEQQPILRGYARQALAAWAVGNPYGEGGAVAQRPEADAALMERLRALGYAD